MNAKWIQRPNYFSGEALVTQDFVCEQQYHMTIQRLNNSSLYTYGVATGLDVYWNAAANANQVEVSAGTAIDSLGRQIILQRPEVVQLTGIEPGATYFLTISYYEEYADYADETGVAGYKRVVEVPRIRYVRNLQEPGQNILLAVIVFSSNAVINSITYRSGNAARRYVSSTLGALKLVTEGSGVHGGLSANPFAGDDANDRALFPSLSARQDGTNGAVYMEVDAARSQFTGLLTTRDNVGIGTDSPLANLQLEAIKFKGPGTLTSNSDQVTFSGFVTPFFQAGDILISDPPVKTMTGGVAVFGTSQTRTIVSANADKRQVTVNAAFDPPLDAIPYTYVRATLARFSGYNDTTLLTMNIDGNIGIGVQASTQTGLATAGRAALMITPARRVGIALTDRDPSATLDVNGTIQTDALNVAGQINTGSVVTAGIVYARSFEGNGSKLQNLPILSYWTREKIGTPTSNLYYNDGNVGIRNARPLASLSVGGGNAFVGKGAISSLNDNVVTGYQTAFRDEVSIGDTITIGMIVKQIGVVQKVVDDWTILLQEPMAIGVTDSPYSYQPPGSDTAQPGQGTITANGSTVTGKGTAFTTAVTLGGSIVIGRFEAANPALPRTLRVKSVDSHTQLTLSQPSGKSVKFDAATSAYVVTTSMLAHIAANTTNGVQPEDKLPPPAMIVTTNNNPVQPNTVAINYELGEITGQYALQVNGMGSFTSLDVAGTQINPNGSVQTIGTRSARSLSNNNRNYRETAQTDGYVMVTIGQPTYTANYCGVVAGTTLDAAGNITSFTYATGMAYEYDTSKKKHNGKKYRIPAPGSMLMPVRKGEQWMLQLTPAPDFPDPPLVEFYWVPLGQVSNGLQAADDDTAPTISPHAGMAAMHGQLRDDLESGRLRASVQESTQQAISERMDDLTKILGDATGMSGDVEARRRFTQALAKIVCSPVSEPQRSTSPEFAQSVQSLIDVFAQVTNHTFTQPERGVLADGVRALVRINDNDENRHDLDLIKQNIGFFIDSVQNVLQLQLDASKRRLLTRALVRLVGDGSGGS